jgi:hypothetical protein
MTRPFWLAALTAGIWIGLVDPAVSAPAPVRLLVPAYFYPSGQGLKSWEQLLAAAGKTPIVAIVNPASGPGKQVDEHYRALLLRARRSKLTLIGYVTLGYARRPVADVKADVDRWLSFYPEIGGIFFDEQPSGPEHAAFAADCFAHA